LPSRARDVDVRRSGERYLTRAEGVTIRHAFSSGQHYDSTNTSYGPLLVHDEIALGPGAGFPAHFHRDVEIVTWVLAGSLAHEDDAGNRGLILPGVVQRLSAGTGVVHSEHAAGDDGAHVLQMWVAADSSGSPSYASCAVDEAELSGGLVPVASGLPGRRGAVGLAAEGAALLVGRLGPGSSRLLPQAPRVHLHVARGTVVLEGVGSLSAGDAVRLSEAGGRAVRAEAAADLVVWELHPRAG
jgi:hypothetical protein